MLRLSSIFTIKCSPRFLKHQFPSALCLFATLLFGLAANAVAVPMLQFLDLATTIVGNRPLGIARCSGSAGAHR